jgi:maltose alpha-D-glucosyltransferase/alpha-amylase
MLVKKPCSATDPLWYKDAIIYEIHVRAFADSNEDGIGDFPGLISKLDYLQELGVTCLWLLPFFPSPLRDDGYDIADYVSVNPSYGSIEDFRKFLDATHARNMQVMIELVINHTSDQHPWFRTARLAPKGSPEREMYVWSDTDKLYDGVRIIFTDTEKSNWTWDEVAQQYYWHRFFSHQPDLNFDNPRVMEEVLNAMRFWMDMGVDGLRLDAIPYLIERDGTSCENVPETHQKIKEIRAAIDAEYENRLVLAEANMWPADVRPYFGDGDECNMAFHFPLMPRIYMAIRQEDRLPITDIMAQTPDIPDSCQWGLFLRNHDELTLEMVTDDERDYMNMAYAADPRMRINVGIRRRLAPLVDNNRRRIELLNSLLLSFPGTPILYYGDEIGMGDNIYLGDRNGVRTPMQWNSDRNAGFSKAVPARLYFPVIMDPIWGYQAINVEAQQSDPSSLLHWTRNMIALRKLFQVFGRGTLEFLHPDNRKVLAYIREYTAPDGHQETVLCVANLSRFAQPVQLDLARFSGWNAIEMLGYVPFPPIDNTPYAVTLSPYGFFWLELQKPNKTPSVPTDPDPEQPELEKSGPIASTNRWQHDRKSDFFNVSQKRVEELLPPFIRRQRWFGKKSADIQALRISSTHAIESFIITVVEIDHSDSTTSFYQLPLAALSIDEASTLPADASIGSLNSSTRLCDATFVEPFRAALLRSISTAPQVGTGIAATKGGANFSAIACEQSRLGSLEQSNTSILYGDKAMMKVYRQLQRGENPDVEIARFLSADARFKAAPAFLGDLHLNTDDTTLVFLQAFAPNEGDGWQWTLASLGNFFKKVGATKPHNMALRTSNFSATTVVSNEMGEQAGSYLQAAQLIGKRTAEMHIALASGTENENFKAESFTVDELKSLRANIVQQTNFALDRLSASMASLPADAATKAALLLELRFQLLALPATLAGDPLQFGKRIRIHGDYHLGQLLRTAEDFLIVDFEGEPARPLSERRHKQSPLKDVAGMLRSFGYAAGAALAVSDNNASADWASSWESSAGNAFLLAYRESMGSHSELLPDAQQFRNLLLSLILEKAVYELMYELNNRPTWILLPLQGLIELASASNL